MSHVLDGPGTIASGGGCSHVSAGGQPGGGGRNVSWFARSNKTYKVYFSVNSFARPDQLLTTVTAGGFANPPWYAFTNTIVDVTATNVRFYAVEVQP